MSRQKILEFIGFLSAVVSLGSFSLENKEWNAYSISLLISTIVIFLIASYFLFVKKETKKLKSQEKINAFMKYWIKTSGVVKILSRDLSWVDEEVLGIMQAKGSDLYLYVEEENEKVKKIRANNPEGNYYFYKDIGFNPLSRFTVIHANKQDKQIAIAIKEQNGYKKIDHEIYVSKGSQIDNKILGLAIDLMNCIECKGQVNGKKNS